MRQVLYTVTVLLIVFFILLAKPGTVLASEGDGESQMEVEVNGYHVTLSSQDTWAQGKNTVIVTLRDAAGVPLEDAGVELLILPRTEAHSEAASESHDSAAGHSAVPGSQAAEPETAAHEMPSHAEETGVRVLMAETHDHGSYVAQAQLDSAGEHRVQIMFHADGDMLEAGFVVVVPGSGSKAVLLWSFAAVNAALLASAGILKKQSLSVKGGV